MLTTGRIILFWPKIMRTKSYAWQQTSVLQFNYVIVSVGVASIDLFCFPQTWTMFFARWILPSGVSISTAWWTLCESKFLNARLENARYWTFPMQHLCAPVYWQIQNHAVWSLHCTLHWKIHTQVQMTPCNVQACFCVCRFTSTCTGTRKTKTRGKR